MIITVSKEELKPFLMEPKATGLIKEPFFVIKGDNNQEVIIVSPGKNGAEFNKTSGSFHKFPGVQTYHVVYGQGVMLTQRNDLEGQAKEFRVMSIRSGMTIEVPAGYGHCLVNVGKTYLVVVADVNPGKATENSELLAEKHGFVYYLVDKKGDVGFEPNPNYRIHPQITT